MKKTTLILLFALCTLNFARSQQGAIQLPATGQTTSYYPGDDGDLQKGVHWPAQRFTDLGNGTLTDVLTNLMWPTEGNILAARDPEFDQDCIAGDGSVDWKTALDYIALLNAENYLGHNDWRLPNMKELTSLSDLGRGDTSLSTGHPFCNLQQSYWSSTSSWSRNFAYCVTMFYWQIHSNSYWLPGEVHLEMKILPMDGYENFRKIFVLPVRGNTNSGLVELPRTFQHFALYPGDDKSLSMGVEWPQARLIYNGDSTVTDRLTGLMWAQKVNLQSLFPDFAPPYNDFSWETALDFVEMLNDIQYKGFNDWRLPNRNELMSVKNCGESYRFTTLSKYHPFLFDDSRWVFSSSTVAADPGKFYCVIFAEGYVQYELVKTEFFSIVNAWPVRDDNSTLPGGSVTGSIMANSVPVQGVKLSFEGPVNTVIFTGNNGLYDFDHIPAGQYTISLEKDYYDFAPNPVTINVSYQTITQNFTATLNSTLGWTDLRGNMPESAVLHDVFAVGEHVWLCGGRDRVYYSSDGGATFVVHDLPEDVFYSTSIFMKSENEGYIITSGGYVLYSNDATNGNWSVLYNTGKVLNSIHMPPTLDRAFACGESGAIISFTNDDYIDMSMPELSEALFSVMFPVTAEEGWLCGNNTVRRFYNNSWINLQIWGDVSPRATFFVDNTTGWVAGGTDWIAGRIIKTEDGITYQPQFDSDATIGFKDIIFVSPQEGWTLGPDVIFHTVDAGENWDRQAIATTWDKSLIALFFTSPEEGYAAGSDQFLKFGPLEPGVGVPEQQPFESHDVRVFPNPTHGKFQIISTKHQTNPKFKNKIYRVEIMDLNGKVLELWNAGTLEHWNSGTLELDISHLPAGLYFCRIQSGNLIVVKKIILLK